MRRADRLFKLVQLLKTRRLSTGSELASELGVSLRTLYRDIQELRDADVPIRGEAGVGYALDNGYVLPPMRFNALELEALVLGARMVQTWGDEGLSEAARDALRKVEAVLPGPLRQVVLETPLHAFRFGPTPPDNLTVLRGAINDGLKVRFDYRDRHDTPTTRTVHPLGLVFWGRSWGLAAWCELREGYRNFRPDRMVAAPTILDERFEGSSLSDFMDAMRSH